MTSLNDPRLLAYTYGGDATPVAPGDKDASELMDGSLLYPAWYDLGSQPVHLMSKAELYFILAEAQLRLGEDATAAFQTAVTASIEEIFDLVGPDYIDKNNSDVNAYVASLGTPDLKKLFQQKYLAQCMDEQVETYNDIRRLQAMGESYITLTNPMNTQSGINRFPYRLPYGNSAVLGNPNVAAAYGDGFYVYTEKTWINGGK